MHLKMINKLPTNVSYVDMTIPPYILKELRGAEASICTQVPGQSVYQIIIMFYLIPRLFR